MANVASFIEEQRRARPDAVAVIEQRTGRNMTFADLGRRVENVANGLTQLGICNGARTVMAIKPGLEFVVTVFALFRAGAVPVVVDPGMGKDALLKCIAEAKPSALVGIPLAHALSLRYRGVFGDVKRVTVGRRWLWGGATYEQLAQRQARGGAIAPTRWHDAAAILFTSGATGAPKGVVYHHGIFVSQTRMIRDTYGIQPGEVDVACFALFALFSVAMGVTVVLPDMDFSRPASVDPAKIVSAIRQHKATMAFASPAVWRKVGPYLLDHNLTLPTLRRVLIAGAAVPYQTLAQIKDRIAPDGDVHTPYGATESLPLSTIAASEVLAETRYDTQAGKGVCVGKPVAGVEARVVAITDGPIAHIDDARELPVGEVGEVIVSSPPTTREYFNRPEATSLAKIGDAQLWHRMGDTGFKDAQGRLWYCGRVAHTVWTAQGPLFPEQVEGVFNNHNAVSRSALVGVGDKGAQEPVVVIECHDGYVPDAGLQARIGNELLAMAAQHVLTRQVKRVLFHGPFPVDARHNSKINREALALWATAQAEAAKNRQGPPRQ
ncbi:MAG: AMP-binding protein [Planctomycetes bacterium]|nr:AMP-binding protein [Planctomycetota bacterium]MCW8136329.1 AMP-binding protein [Planctomycetota bacterium]